MKKLILILILTTGWLVSDGQLYPPIQPYLENDYSISQIKDFALAKTELSSSWRREILAIVNNALLEAKEDMVLGEGHIDWLLDHIVYERRKLTKFENSRNILNKVKFYPDKNYDGMVGVFKYGNCSVVVFKTRCINLLKVSTEITEITQVNPFGTTSVGTDTQPTGSQTNVVSKTDWSFQQRVHTQTTVPDLNLPPPQKERKKIKIGRIVIPIGILATLVTGFLLKKNQKQGAAADIGGPKGAPGHPATPPSDGAPSGAPGSNP